MPTWQAYKQTVLTAFQQVEDYIATLRVLSEQISKQNSAIQAAQRYLISPRRVTRQVSILIST